MGHPAAWCSVSVVHVKNEPPEQQILRLTTPKLHPANEDLFAGTPEVRLGPRSLRMTELLLGEIWGRDNQIFPVIS